MCCVELYSMYLNQIYIYIYIYIWCKMIQNILRLAQKHQWLVVDYVVDWFCNKYLVCDFFISWASSINCIKKCPFMGVFI